MRRRLSVREQLEIVERKVGKETFKRYEEVYEMLCETVGIDSSLQEEAREGERWPPTKGLRSSLSTIANILRRYREKVPALDFNLKNMLKYMDEKQALTYMYGVFKEYENALKKEDVEAVRSCFEECGIKDQ